jgi:hypothetical protein
MSILRDLLEILLLKPHTSPMPITEYRDRVGHIHVGILEVAISNIGQEIRFAGDGFVFLPHSMQVYSLCSNSKRLPYTSFPINLLNSSSHETLFNLTLNNFAEPNLS